MTYIKLVQTIEYIHETQDSKHQLEKTKNKRVKLKKEKQNTVCKLLTAIDCNSSNTIYNNKVSNMCGYKGQLVIVTAISVGRL